MQHVKCVSRHPVDLADGRVLARGETANVDEKQPHNAALIEGGALIELVAVEKPRRRSASSEEDNT